MSGPISPIPRGHSNIPAPRGPMQVNVRQVIPDKIVAQDFERCSARTGRAGNVRVNLENNLIKHYFKDDPDNPELQELLNPELPEEPEVREALLTRRQEILDAMQPNIEALHGKLPREDMLNADSPIQFKTWEYLDPDGNRIGTCLKLEMTWQIELKDGTIIESKQEIEVPGTVMVDPTKISDIEHCKHLALLYVKSLRKVQKKAMTPDYKINPGNRHVPTQENREALLKGLRETNIFSAINHPSKNLIGPARVITGHAERVLKKETAWFTQLGMHTGYTLDVGYSHDVAKGRKKVKRYNIGDPLPGGGIANKVYWKFEKCDSEDLTYSAHLLNQARKGKIVDDSPFGTFERLSESRNIRNLKNELQANNIDEQQFRVAERKKFKGKKKEFQQRYNGLRGQITGRFPLNIPATFAPNKIFKFTIDSVVKNFQDSLQKYQNANPADKREAFEALKKAYEGIKDLHEFVDQLQKVHDEMIFHRNRIYELPPSEDIEKDTYVARLDETLQAQSDKIGNFQVLINAQADINEAKRIIDRNRVHP